MHECDLCGKEFKSLLALSGHKRVHGESNGIPHFPKICHIETREIIAAKNLQKYEKSLKLCKHVINPSNLNMPNISALIHVRLYLTTLVENNHHRQEKI